MKRWEGYDFMKDYSLSILWRTVTHNLPPLVQELQRILDENGE